jgi:hypothetical protein
VTYNRTKRDRVKEAEIRIREKLSSHWSVKVESSQLNYLEKLEKERRRLEAEARSINALEMLEQ